ncbi:Hypothetical predicted protein, partial [Pelobates cultripes]
PGDKVLVKSLFKSGTFDPPYSPLTTVVAITRRAVLTEENQTWIHASRLKRCPTSSTLDIPSKERSTSD